MDRIFTDWQKKHTDCYSKHLISAQHNLHESPLFSDEALARLIEIAPRDSYHVNTMDPSEHNPGSWKEGDIGDLSGMQVLDAVREGKIWVLIQRVGDLDPTYQNLMDKIFGEISNNVPGFNSFKEKMSILISSPKIQVYYHCDIPGQSLWQIRGRKKVYIYPNSSPFLEQEWMEKIILNEIDEQDMPYEPWFDDYADVVDLEPGMMAHWPINGPHRVVNEDCLNVSFTTEHWTKDLRNHYAMHYANGILRRSLGVKNLSMNTTGLGFLPKLALAGVVKKLGLQRAREMAFKIEFKVDPLAPGGYRNVPAYDLRKS